MTKHVFTKFVYFQFFKICICLLGGDDIKPEQAQGHCVHPLDEEPRGVPGNQADLLSDIHRKPSKLNF